MLARAPETDAIATRWVDRVLSCSVLSWIMIDWTRLCGTRNAQYAHARTFVPPPDSIGRNPAHLPSPPPPHASTQRSLTANLSRTLALAAVAALLAISAFAVAEQPRVASAQAEQVAGFCSRNAVIRDGIVSAVFGKSTCQAITSSDLSGVTSLWIWFNFDGIGALQRSDFAGLTGLTRLYLQANAISSLPANVFDDLAALQWLDLSTNELTSLPDGIFDELTNLENLKLGGNNFRTFPADQFDGLTNLDTLVLSQNPFTSLPSDLFDGLTNLEDLWIRGTSFTDTPLTSLPADLFDGLTSLDHLELSRNALTTVDSGWFSDLTALEILRLGDNAITSIPQDAFDGLTSLETLYLNGNQLSSLHEDVFDGLDGSLENLSVGGNALTSLPEDLLDGLTGLSYFSAADNQLTELPANLFEDPGSALTMIYLGGNQFESLPASLLTGQTALARLHLQDNLLTRLPDGLLTGKTTLTELQLGGEGFFTQLPLMLARTPGDQTEVKLSIPVGAPFELEIGLSATGATIEQSGSPITSITIAAGGTESATFDITPAGGDTQMLFELEPPALPAGNCPSWSSDPCHGGYEIAAGMLLGETESSEVMASGGTVTFTHNPALNVRFYQYRRCLADKTGCTALMNFNPRPGVAQQSISFEDLEPDTMYLLQVRFVTMDGFAGHFQSQMVQTDLAPAPSEFEAVRTAHSVTLQWKPITLVTPSGYEFRYRATGELGWTRWRATSEEQIEGFLTHPVYALDSESSYTFELRGVTGTDSYSEVASASAGSFVSLPQLRRVDPLLVTITVRPGETVKLTANVYSLQDTLINDQFNGGQGDFNIRGLGLSWSDGSGGGSFNDAELNSATVYTTPPLPGTYIITAEAVPPGICESDHIGFEGLDPCVATTTVHVTRAPDTPEAPPDPINPPDLIPTSLTDSAGTAYAVFLPVEGGTFTGEGITVSALPGAVPDRTLVGVAATTAGAVPAPIPGARMTLAGTFFDIMGVDRDGAAPVTGYTFDDPISACVPLPAIYRENVSDVVLVEQKPDGTLGVLSTKIRQTGGSLGVCGSLTNLPATVAVAKLGIVEPPPPDPDTGTGDPLPDTGATTPYGAPWSLWSVLIGAAILLATTRVITTRGRRTTLRQITGR